MHCRLVVIVALAVLYTGALGYDTHKSALRALKEDLDQLSNLLERNTLKDADPETYRIFAGASPRIAQMLTAERGAPGFEHQLDAELAALYDAEKKGIESHLRGIEHASSLVVIAQAMISIMDPDPHGSRRAAELDAVHHGVSEGSAPANQRDYFGVIADETDLETHYMEADSERKMDAAANVANAALEGIGAAASHIQQLFAKTQTVADFVHQFGAEFKEEYGAQGGRLVGLQSQAQGSGAQDPTGKFSGNRWVCKYAWRYPYIAAKRKQVFPVKGHGCADDLVCTRHSNPLHIFILWFGVGTLKMRIDKIFGHTWGVCK